MAEENPERDIYIDPKWPILEDGLGYQFLLVGGIPYKDANGKDMVKLTVIPDKIDMKRYNLRLNEELDSRGRFTFVAEEIDLIQLNPYDDANKKFLYVRSIKGGETNLSKRYEKLKSDISYYQELYLQKEAQNIRLSEKLNLATTNPEKMLLEGSEIYTKVAESIAKITQAKQGGQNG